MLTRGHRPHADLILILCDYARIDLPIPDKGEDTKFLLLLLLFDIFFWMIWKSKKDKN